MHVEILDHADDVSGGFLISPAAELAADGVLPTDGFGRGFVDQKRAVRVGWKIAGEVPASGELKSE